MNEEFIFESTLWVWRKDGSTTTSLEQLNEMATSKGNWYFVSIPKDVADWVAFFAHHGAWRSVPVSVQVGESQWQTSIFRISKENSYILPVKAAIRKAENLSIGESVSIKLKIR